MTDYKRLVMTNYKRLLELRDAAPAQTEEHPTSDAAERFYAAAHVAVPGLVWELEALKNTCGPGTVFVARSDWNSQKAELDRLRLENEELKSHIELLTYIEADLRAALAGK